MVFSPRYVREIINSSNFRIFEFLKMFYYHAYSHLVGTLPDEGGQRVCEVDRNVRAVFAVLESAAAEAGQVVCLLRGCVRFMLSAGQKLA